MNIKSRLELAGNALLAILDPQYDFMPTNGYEYAHDLGRWWDAALRLESAIGFVIPADLEAASLRNLKSLTDNPDRLLTNRTDVPWQAEKAKINPHNFRESLIAFCALVRHRNSRWAHQAGLDLVRAMDRCFQADGCFDFTRLGSWGDVPHTDDPSHTEPKRDAWFDGTATSGRAIEALVWLYEATRESDVLALAQRIAEHHLAYSTNSDGAVRQEIVDPQNVGHCHSYLGTMRGLLLFGLLTKQKKYVQTVEATYRNAVRNRIIKESGWAPHDLGKMRFPNETGQPTGENASTGDAAQLALWLALYANCHDLFDDVERLVRARLIPAQITEEDARNHPDREFAPREIGAWGCHGPCHAGKGCTPDVHAAVIHTMCDIYQNICTHNRVGLQVNLHLDFEDDHVAINSTRDDRGKLSVVVKQPQDVMIRIPGWAPQNSLKLTVNGKAVPIKPMGVFAWIARDALSANDQITLSYELPVRSTQEPMSSGRMYDFKWRGDEIIGVSPQDQPLPYYAAITD